MWQAVRLLAASVLLLLAYPQLTCFAARPSRRLQDSTDNTSMSAPLLALPGPLFASSLPIDSTVSSTPSPHPHHLLIHGYPLLYPTVPAQSISTSHAVNTARHAWDAAFVLSKLIERYNPVAAAEGGTVDGPPLPASCESASSGGAKTHHRWLLTELRMDSNSVVVELGAGVHMLPTLSAWRVGAGTVTVTDVQEMTEWMQLTADINTQHATQTGESTAVGRLRVSAVDWTVQNEQLLPIHPPPTLLLASDVIWLHELIPALTRTITTLLSHSRPPSILYLAHQHRSAIGWRRFEEEAERAALSVQQIHRCLQVESYSSEKVDVYRISQQAQ